MNIGEHRSMRIVVPAELTADMAAALGDEPDGRSTAELEAEREAEAYAK